MSRRVDAAFSTVLASFARDPDVTTSQMFGSPGLKVRGRFFAMLVNEALVLKLPEDRVDELIVQGTGARFNPGHGRLMREWVAVEGAERSWSELATEARRFVAGATGRGHGG